MFAIAAFTLFNLFCGFSAWTIDTINYEIMIQNGLITLVILLFVWFNHGSNNDFMLETEKLIDANSLFKTIFDNLRESVLLV